MGLLAPQHQGGHREELRAWEGGAGSRQDRAVREGRCAGEGSRGEVRLRQGRAVWVPYRGREDRGRPLLVEGGRVEARGGEREPCWAGRWVWLIYSRVCPACLEDPYLCV